MLFPLFVVDPAKPVPDELISYMYEIFSKKNNFKVGDIVMWKPGMKTQNIPRYGDAMVIHSVNENPNGVGKEMAPHEASYWDVCDCSIGYCAQSVLHFAGVDQRRLMPFDQKIATEMRKTAAEDDKKEGERQQSATEKALGDFANRLGNSIGNAAPPFAPPEDYPEEDPPDTET